MVIGIINIIVLIGYFGGIEYFAIMIMSKLSVRRQTFLFSVSVVHQPSSYVSHIGTP